MILKRSKANNKTKIVNIVDFKNKETDTPLDDSEFKSLFDN
jgi:hypothetical protein